MHLRPPNILDAGHFEKLQMLLSFSNHMLDSLEITAFHLTSLPSKLFASVGGGCVLAIANRYEEMLWPRRRRQQSPVLLGGDPQYLAKEREYFFLEA